MDLSCPGEGLAMTVRFPGLPSEFVPHIRRLADFVPHNQEISRSLGHDLTSDGPYYHL